VFPFSPSLYIAPSPSLSHSCTHTHTHTLFQNTLNLHLHPRLNPKPATSTPSTSEQHFSKNKCRILQDVGWVFGTQRHDRPVHDLAIHDPTPHQFYNLNFRFSISGSESRSRNCKLEAGGEGGGLSCPPLHLKFTATKPKKLEPEIASRFWERPAERGLYFPSFSHILSLLLSSRKQARRGWMRRASLVSVTLWSPLNLLPYLYIFLSS